ncbi:hypothetical protein O7623_09095 [Solwaraspora sp. WMMD791]|uniref:hypothetical protein n=1 Tax=Solwaraspora sp. WMMD791 TaxID=3016086 RepID=UPI00249A27F6|nr:hypothetical protein [Solwaraspora sp. WMMD791]WFE29326.1 hypothetical protein O7623_09095 [Solwaraspora sp. WMMD791]
MSSDFDEYAALARHLHDLHRTGQAGSAQHQTRRQRLTGYADQLGQRLYAQWQRLAAIAQAAGEPAPPAPPPIAATPAAGNAPGQQRSGGYGASPAGVPWPPPPPPPPGRAMPGQAGPGPAGLPPPPRRPELATSEQPVPLSAGAFGPSAQAEQVQPYGVGAGAAGPVSAAPVSGDPAAVGGFPPDAEQELEAARRQLDEADAAATEAEQAAARPPLLPGFTPLARAVTVYLGFAAAVAALQFAIFLNPFAATVDVSTKFIWSCTGFPAMGFFAAYFVISKWGRSRLETDGGPRFPKLGFLISFAGAAASILLLLVFLQLDEF